MELTQLVTHIFEELIFYEAGMNGTAIALKLSNRAAIAWKLNNRTVILDIV